ncbi:leucine-rich repeat protein [Saccharicrinis sp. FJH54]|uniref:leucine-rich repeat protein n=1 Tax=Saccharicrinis sp. FJH54 TaxID=3344665 RepID=UPI0035D48F2E
MKKWCTLLLLVLSVNLINAQNYVLTADDVVIVDGYIVACNALQSVNIEIPSAINGQEIVGIAEPEDGGEGGVFRSKNIQSLKFSETIKYIGSYSFADNSITNLDFSQAYNLDSIGNNAFSDNPISSIDFSNCVNLSKIGSFVFCSASVESFILPGIAGQKWYGFELGQAEPEIPASISDVGDMVSACTYLIYKKEVHVSEDNPYILADSDVETSGSMIYAVNHKFIGKYILIPESFDNVEIKSIVWNSTAKAGAFSNLGLLGVTLPQSIEYINKYSFANNSIQSVNFSQLSKLKLIGEYAFAGNPMTYFILPENTSEDAFAGWIDSNGQLYNSGDTIRDFTLSYEVYLTEASLIINIIGDFDHATITINDKTYISNGHTSIPSLSNGKYPYTIEADGYLVFYDTVEINGSRQIVFAELEETPYDSPFGVENSSYNVLQIIPDAFMTDSIFYVEDISILNQVYKTFRSRERAGDFYIRVSSDYSKIYQYINDAEYLVMDLDLEKNDTFLLHYENSADTILVDSVYYVDSKKHVRLNFLENEFGFERFEFIEGLGTNHGLFYQNTAPFDFYEKWFLLLCAYRDGENFYINHFNEFSGHCAVSHLLNTDENTLDCRTVVYPNPVVDILTINNINGIERIELYDLSGRQVEIVKHNIAKLDLSYLEPGDYLLKVVRTAGTQVVKISKW